MGAFHNIIWKIGNVDRNPHSARLEFRSWHYRLIELSEIILFSTCRESGQHSECASQAGHTEWAHHCVFLFSSSAFRFFELHIQVFLLVVLFWSDARWLKTSGLRPSVRSASSAGCASNIKSEKSPYFVKKKSTLSVNPWLAPGPADCPNCHGQLH